MNFKKILPLILLCGVIPCITIAQSQENNIQEVITWMYENGLTIFSTSATFHPERTIRRDEASKFIAIFSQEILDQSFLEENPACLKFNDIAKTNSLKDYVVQACKLGYMKGSNNKFNPSGNLTNQQAIAIVIRISEGRLDEPKTDRSKNYYAKADELGLLDGLNLSNKKTAITRGNFATLLYRIGQTYEGENPLDMLGSGLDAMFDFLVEMIGLKINSHSGLNNTFINKAAICESGASVTTDTNFDMMGMNFSMKLYRQINGFEGNQCKIYERIDAVNVAIATGRMQNVMTGGSGISLLSGIHESLGEIQEAMQTKIGKYGICTYTTGALVDNLQKELSGEFIPMGGETDNCTGSLYEETGSLFETN